MAAADQLQTVRDQRARQLELPAMPLDRVALAKWNELLPALRKVAPITVHTRELLTLYCTSWSRYVQAQNALIADGLTTTTGAGGCKPHPAARIAQSCVSQLVQLGYHLNLP
ncbi:MAG: P27 family phage terminase small subunit [Gammaproteobacteria bacterium]